MAASRAIGDEARGEPTTCPRLREIFWNECSDTDDATFNTALQCLTYRKTRGTVLDRLHLQYHESRALDGEVFEELMDRYETQLKGLVNKDFDIAYTD